MRGAKQKRYNDRITLRTDAAQGTAWLDDTEARLNAIAPGYFKTDINDEFLESEAGDKMRKRVPMRRFGDYKELAGALLLLASDAGSYMTGTTIVVDGGHLVSTL